MLVELSENQARVVVEALVLRKEELCKLESMFGPRGSSKTSMGFLNSAIRAFGKEIREMNEMPLTDPSGNTRAWICSVCERVFSLGETNLADACHAANSCCTCRTCGKQVPKYQYCCEDCRKVETEKVAYDLAVVRRIYDDSLAKSLDKEAARQLAEEISMISEDAYCAGWLSKIEYTLWGLMHGRQMGQNSCIRPDSITKLRGLHEKAGGWWHWPSGSKTELFVTTEEWNGIWDARPPEEP